MSLVVPGSPAAMAGLRFGDQLLTLGSAELAGRSEDRVHAMLRSVTVTSCPDTSQSSAPGAAP